MLDSVKDFFRKRALKKFISTEPTSLLPLSDIKTANVVIDVEEPGYDILKDAILALLNDYPGLDGKTITFSN